jgi:hypothetical protein
MTNMVRVSQLTYLILRGKTAELQFKLGKQISMGKLIAAAIKVALEHSEDLIKEIEREASE